MRNEIANLEEQREGLRKRLDRGAFLNKFSVLSSDSDLKASLSDVETRLKHQEYKIEELAPQIDAAKQKIDFLAKEHKGRIDDYLNEPENAQRLFDPLFASEADRSLRAQCLAGSLSASSNRNLYHVLASYEIRGIAQDYSPPVHLQQLRKALVFKEEMKRVEHVLKQVPARKLSLKPIEELARKIHRYSGRNAGIRFAFCRGFPAPPPRAPRRRAPYNLHGANQSRHHRASTRAVALEQSPVRMRSAG